MATTTTLWNPTITINSVDLTDQVQSATFTLGEDQLETTAAGDTGHKYTGGLQTVQVQVTFYNSYGTSETEKVLRGIIGSTTSIVAQAAPGAISASNPEVEVTGTFLASYTPINGSYGQLSTSQATFNGGTWVVNES